MRGPEARSSPVRAALEGSAQGRRGPGLPWAWARCLCLGVSVLCEERDQEGKQQDFPEGLARMCSKMEAVDHRQIEQNRAVVKTK